MTGIGIILRALAIFALENEFAVFASLTPNLLELTNPYVSQVATPRQRQLLWIMHFNDFT